jgi:ribonuclease D
MKLIRSLKKLFRAKPTIDWNPQFTIVDTEAELRKTCAVLNTVNSCVIDTEADSMHHYATRLCLIQVSAAGKHWLVDPLAPIDVAPLWRTSAMNDITLHGADYDLRMLGSHYGFYPKKIYDTMIAAKFLGEEHFGLAYLVEKYFSHKLMKENQRADWTIRPLPPQMCEYAVFDTIFLEAIRGMQTERLRQMGRLGWLEETCASLMLTARDFNKKVHESEGEPWRAVRGTKRFSSLECQLLRALWNWRDAEACALDRPTYKVLGPDQMIDIVVSAAIADTPLVSEDLPRLPRNFKGARLQSFMKTLRVARGAPESQWPSAAPPARPKGPSPNAQLMEKLRELRERKAAELGFEVSMLGNKNQLVELAAFGDATWEERFEKAALMPWQREVWLDMLSGL